MFIVPSLCDLFGKPKYLSPLSQSFNRENFVQDPHDRILSNISWQHFVDHRDHMEVASFELAGPREYIFWNPKSTRVAIVTCGGLAPGLNNVLQSIVNVLLDRYGVSDIYGIPFGFSGFTHDPHTKKFRFQWIPLDAQRVQNIDSEAGSILGNGRGHSNPEHIVDALEILKVNILFTLGGDGTLKASHAICEQIARRNLPISVVGIPKTVDNDIPWVSKSFGFESAVAQAAKAIRCAQTEARSAHYGIGLVKLMGRNSGALTATASASVSDLDYVLVPEVKLVLEGDKGFLAHMQNCLQTKGYATVVVAEGAGQHLMPSENNGFDPSGNAKLRDIGVYLKSAIIEFFKTQKMDVTLKYIDPSYMLRAQTTSTDDSIFCAHLGQHAVHAAMAGKTALMVGYAHESFTHVPLQAVAVGKKELDINGPLWLSVLASTGQPAQWIRS